MRIRPAVQADLDAMVLLAAAHQSRPERHIGYLGLDGSSIRADVLGVDRWVERTAVVLDSAGDLAGWLLGEKDDVMNRAWWWGPFMTDDAWHESGDELYLATAEVVDAAEQEMAPDDRNRRAAELATRNGFQDEMASAVLSYTGLAFGASGVTTQMAREHRRAVAGLHDRLFPGTHTTGEALVAADAVRLVVVENGRVVGYVAAEIHSDDSGYIDYLGVEPGVRRRGIGRQLVMEATDRLLGDGVSSVNLTVRENNAPARALYAALNFAHERLVRPYRKGFTLEEAT